MLLHKCYIRNRMKPRIQACQQHLQQIVAKQAIPASATPANGAAAGSAAGSAAVAAAAAPVVSSSPSKAVLVPSHLAPPMGLPWVDLPRPFLPALLPAWVAMYRFSWSCSEKPLIWTWKQWERAVRQRERAVRQRDRAVWQWERAVQARERAARQTERAGRQR